MPKTKCKVIFFGSDSFVVQVLKSLEENFDVVGVVTTQNSAVANYADKKFPIFTPEKLDADFNTKLLALNSELTVVASYGKIIPQSTLDIPKYGALNIHPSLLPKHRGPSPVPTTILNGDKETGVTIMKMDAEMDHGPIINTKEISLTGKEDLQELINKLFQLGSELLIEVIPDYIEGKVKLIEQDHDQATYTKHLTKEDGYFDIDNPPAEAVLDRMIRAYHPWPGVWTIWRVKSPELDKLEITTLFSGDKGKIVKFLPNGLIQMEGKKPMSLKDFLNGYPTFPLKIL